LKRGSFPARKPTSGALPASKFDEVSSMFAIFFILLIMWALGMISSYTFGGAIHLLLVFALIVLVIRLVQGRSVA
jgi:Family of unknown function (DUF5670)